MLRFIHAADLHLDSAFRALGPGKAARLRQERRETLFRLADYVNGHGVGLVLLAGSLAALSALLGETGIWLSPLCAEGLCLAITAGFSVHYVRTLRRQEAPGRGVPCL